MRLFPFNLPYLIMFLFALGISASATGTGVPYTNDYGNGLFLSLFGTDTDYCSPVPADPDLPQEPSTIFVCGIWWNDKIVESWNWSATKPEEPENTHWSGITHPKYQYLILEWSYAEPNIECLEANPQDCYPNAKTASGGLPPPDQAYLN